MMKTLRSQLCGAATMASLCLAGVASGAQNITLEIVRDSGGNVVQSVPITSWDYDHGRRTLDIRTDAGDRQCGNAAGTSGKMRLRLDGVSYGLETFTPPSRSRPVLRIRPVSDGVFPLCASGSSNSDRVTYVAKGGTALGVEMDILENGARVRRELPVAGPIVHKIGLNPEVDADLVSPPLCVNLDNTGGQLDYEDLNGLPISLRGIAPTSYRVADRVLGMGATSGLTCFAFPTSTASTGTSAACGTDHIFLTSFEATGSDPQPVDTALQLNLRLVTNPALDTGDPAHYELVVRNCGTTALSNVHVREFFPGPNYQGAGARLAAAPTVNCDGFDCVNDNEYVAYTIPTLAAGAEDVVSVERALASGGINQTARITAAVVVNPEASSMPLHAIKSWDLAVVDTNNIAPTLTGTASLVMSEDGGPTPVSGVLTAADVDSVLSCSNGSCVQVTSSAPSIIASGDVDASFNNGAITLSVTPRPNAFTLSGQPVQLSVRVQDAEGGLSNAIQVPVTVTAVNDPPSFEIGAGFDRTAPASKAIIISGSEYCTMQQSAPNGAFSLIDANCPHFFWESNPAFLDRQLVYNAWIQNASAGPGESGTATISVQLLSDPNSVVADWTYETGTFNVGLTGAKGTAMLRVTASDGALQTSVDVSVDVDNARPVITSNGGGDTGTADVSENTVAVTTVTATDADDAAVDLTYGISGADAVLFIIDANTGVLEFVDAPDFEDPLDANLDGVYEVTVTASDSAGGSDSQALSVTVVNVNEAPVIAAGQVFNVPENSAFNTIVGTVAASDPEGQALGGFAWDIIDGNTDENTSGTPAFYPNGRQIRVADPGDLDFENKNSFILTIEVDDGVNPPVSETVTVNVTDVAE